MFCEEFSSLCRRRCLGRRTALESGTLLLGPACSGGPSTAAWAAAHCCGACRTAAWAAAYCSGVSAQRGSVRCCSSQCGRRRLCFWLFIGRFVVLGAVTRVASCADRLRRNRMTESSRTFEIVGDGEGQRLVAAGRRKTTGCHRLSEGGYLPVAAESDEGRPTCSESAAGSSWCSSLSARSFSALKT